MALAQAIDLRLLVVAAQVHSQASEGGASIYMSYVNDAAFPSRISIFPANY